MKRKNGQIVGDISVAGYVRIRKYVIDNIIYGEKKPQRLTSMRELAAQFGVGSTTVQKALKELVADGYLIPKTGVGMFTNPQRWRRSEKPPIVELLAADGKQIYFENFLCCMNAAAAMAITGAGYFLHHVDLFQNNEGALAETGGHSRGLLWVVPERASGKRAGEFFHALTLPRAVIAGIVEGFDSVDFDREREGYELTCELLAEGRRRIMVLTNTTCSNRELGGIRRAFAERGLTFDDSMIFDDNQDMLGEFRSYSDRFGVPDAIYDTGGGPVRLWDEFRTRNVDLADRCRLILADDRPSPVPCRMLKNDYARLAAAGMELLERRIKDPGCAPETRLFRREVYQYDPSQS